ncbi:hypothetical protein KAH81_06170 [bacterium]|nr:hypothetical protein [bacterium]
MKIALIIIAFCAFAFAQAIPFSTQTFELSKDTGTQPKPFVEKQQIDPAETEAWGMINEAIFETGKTTTMPISSENLEEPAKKEGNGTGDGQGNGNHHGQRGPKKRPKGWDKGEKKGWNGSDIPPGQSKKSGSGNSGGGKGKSRNK